MRKSKGSLKGKGKVKENEIEDLKNQLVRALADYDNLRKRVEKEKDIFEKIASLKFIVKILPVLDMLEGAQDQLKDSGLALILKEFYDVLREEKVVRIKSDKGTLFDEEVHEAVETVKGKEKGKIAEEVLSGWQHEDGFVVRPAKVKVFK